MIAYCCAGSFLRLFHQVQVKKLSTTIKGKLFSDNFLDKEHAILLAWKDGVFLWILAWKALVQGAYRCRAFTFLCTSCVG